MTQPRFCRQAPPALPPHSTSGETKPRGRRGISLGAEPHGSGRTPGQRLARRRPIEDRGHLGFGHDVRAHSRGDQGVPGRCRSNRKNANRKRRSLICGVPRDPASGRIPRPWGTGPSYDGKRISTRRFCGSRTPSGVGTRRSLKLRPLTAISLRATPSAAIRPATALARRSESR